MNRRHALVLAIMIAAVIGLAFYMIKAGFFMHGD